MRKLTKSEVEALARKIQAELNSCEYPYSVIAKFQKQGVRFLKSNDYKILKKYDLHKSIKDWAPVFEDIVYHDVTYSVSSTFYRMPKGQEVTFGVGTDEMMLGVLIVGKKLANISEIEDKIILTQIGGPSMTDLYQYVIEAFK